MKDPNARLESRFFTYIAPYMVSLLMDDRRWAEAEPLYEGMGKPERAASFRQKAGSTAKTTNIK